MTFAATRHTPTVGPYSGTAFAGIVDEAAFLLASITPAPLSAYAGTANAATAMASPTLPAWVTGNRFSGSPTSTNTAAGPTLAIDGLAAKTIADADGVDLAVGAHVAGRRYDYFYDGTKLRVIGSIDGALYKLLNADDTGGTNVSTAQPWFPTAGGITLPGSKTYFFEGFLSLSRAAGTTSHTTSLLFGGTATLTSIDYFATVMTGDADALVSASAVGGHSAAAVVVKAASTSATEQILLRVTGIVRINAGGTFIPQFIYSAAPGGTPTVKRGSYFKLTPIADNAVAAVGAWA